MECNSALPVPKVSSGEDVPDDLDRPLRRCGSGRAGLQQELKREFSFWTTFAVSFAVMGLLHSLATTMEFGIGYSKPCRRALVRWKIRDTPISF